MKYLIVKEHDGNLINITVDSEREMIMHIRSAFDYTDWSIVSVSRLVLKGE